MHVCSQCPNAAVLPEVQYMDKLFEDGIKLFCVDVVLNHFDCLKVIHEICHINIFCNPQTFIKKITRRKVQWCLTCCWPGFRISLGIMNLGPVSPAKPHLQDKKPSAEVYLCIGGSHIMAVASTNSMQTNH